MKIKKNKLSLNENLTRHIIFRMTESEYQKIKEEMRTAGYLNLSKYIRACVIGKEINVTKKVRFVNDEAIQLRKDLIYELKKIGENLNQTNAAFFTALERNKRDERFIMTDHYVAMIYNKVYSLIYNYTTLAKNLINTIKEDDEKNAIKGDDDEQLLKEFFEEMNDD